MKKLVAMIGAVAAAFGLYAADFTSSVTDDIQSKTVGDTTIVGEVDVGTSVIHWWDDNYNTTDYEQPAAVSNETGEVGNYLKIETEGSPLLRTFDAVTTSDEGKASYNAMDITDHGIFIDTKVRLTGFESDPEIKDGNTNKLLVWLKTVESEDDVEGSTNLMVTCGYWDGDGNMTPTNYVLTAEGYEAKPGEWIQLTIRADKDTVKNVPQFKIFVNEKLATATVDDETLDQFPSLVGGAAADLSLKAAGFEGSGDLNKVSLLSQADAPAFAADKTFVHLTWDANVDSIKIGDQTFSGADLEADYEVTAFAADTVAEIAYKNGYRKSAITATGFIGTPTIDDENNTVTFKVAMYGTPTLAVASELARDEATITVNGVDVTATVGTSVDKILAYVNGLAQSDNVKITLGDSTTLSDIVLTSLNNLRSFKGTIEIDLHGCKLTADADGATAADYIFRNNGRMTISDSVGGGSIVAQTGTAGIVYNNTILTLSAVAENAEEIFYNGAIVNDCYFDEEDTKEWFSGIINVNGGLFSVKPTTGVAEHLDDGINLPEDMEWKQDETSGYWYLSAAEPPAAYFPTAKSAAYTGQDGTAEHPFIIMDADDIVAIAEDTDAAIWATKSFKIADEADATLTITDPFTIAADYTGTFDGNGREIVFTAKSSGADPSYAFFAKLNGATIKNVTFNGTVVAAKKLLAIVATTATGNVTFENVVTKGVVTTGYSGAGFVCKASTANLTFTRCENKAVVSVGADQVVESAQTNNKIAGFVCYTGDATTTASFESCTNSASITATVKNCVAASGFWAYQNKLTRLAFTDCVNSGAIYGRRTVSDHNWGAVGGFVAFGEPAANSSVALTNVVSTGSITAIADVQVAGEQYYDDFAVSALVASAPTTLIIDGATVTATITTQAAAGETVPLFAVGSLASQIRGKAITNCEITGDIVVPADVPAINIACDAVTYGVVNGSVVDEFVAANALEVGGAYVVLAPGAAPEIELANENNAITFTGVCEFDDTGITTVDGLKIEKSGTGTVTYTAVPDSKPVVDPSTGANDIPAESAEIACAKVDMAVPTDVAKVISGEDQATYLTYFTKVATPGSAAGLWNVKMELNELGTNTLSAAAEITDITLEADEDGDISLTPTTLVPGFYYGIAASAEVGSVKSATVPAEGWSLATSVTTFDKPLKAEKPSDAKGFFVLKVSPTK